MRFERDQGSSRKSSHCSYFKRGACDSLASFRLTTPKRTTSLIVCKTFESRCKSYRCHAMLKSFSSDFLLHVYLGKSSEARSFAEADSSGKSPLIGHRLDGILLYHYTLLQKPSSFLPIQTCSDSDICESVRYVVAVNLASSLDEGVVRLESEGTDPKMHKKKNGYHYNSLQNEYVHSILFIIYRPPYPPATTFLTPLTAFHDVPSSPSAKGSAPPLSIETATPLPVSWTSHLASTLPPFAIPSVGKRASNLPPAVPGWRVTSPRCQKIKFFSFEYVPTGLLRQVAAFAPSRVSAMVRLLSTTGPEAENAGFKE